MYFYENDDDHYEEHLSYRMGYYNLQKCMDNHHFEPELWGEMVKRFRRH